MHKASKGGARAETALPADKKAPQLAAGGCAKPSNGDPGIPTDGSPLVPLQNHSHEIGSGVAEQQAQQGYRQDSVCALRLDQRC